MKMIFLFVFLFSSVSAWATLGEDLKSVSAGQESKPLRDSKIFEQTNSGLKIRQFVSPGGKVFAVSWVGKIGSQLPELLGSYAAEYDSAEKAHPPRAGRIPYRKVQTGHLVVEHWNLLRKVEGKAYLPSLMPKGLSAKEIKAK